MKLSLLSLACVALGCASIVSSESRVKRQLGGYRFPGPRPVEAEVFKSRASRHEPTYEESAEQYSRANPASYRQPSPSSASYAPSNYQPEQSYPAPARSYSAPRSSSQSYPASNPKERAYSEQDEKDRLAQEEKDRQPTRLEVLLAESKFACSSKKDGYYADESVACQVFHYCVGGAKHSWMCPEATVFHQVHLNCVPASQDICSQSTKYHIVNDYLHKQLETRGPNNTILWGARYYPEEFLGEYLGSPPPAEQPRQGPPRSSVQHYPAPAPQAQRPRAQAYPDSYDDEGYSQPAPAPQSYPSNYNPSPAPRPATRAQPAPRAQPAYAAAQPSYSSGYPTNYPSNRAAASAPAYSAPAPAPASYQPQPAPRAQSYRPASYSSQNYPANYAQSATKPVPTATAYVPSAQPTYKKVVAASVAPVAPAYGSSSRSYGSSPYSSSSRASSSLVDSYAPRLTTGVTYEEDY